MRSILPARRVSIAENPLVNGKGLNPCDNVGDLYHFFWQGQRVVYHPRRYEALPLGRVCSPLGDPQAQRRCHWLFWPPVPRNWRVTGPTTNAFPTEGAKVGLLVHGTKEESNKDGADEAGTGGWEVRATTGIRATTSRGRGMSRRHNYRGRGRAGIDLFTDTAAILN